MKTKTIFLSLFLSLASVGLWAQEKYEYATVGVNDNGLYVVTGDNPEKQLYKPAEKEIVVVKKLNELADKGWEVYSVTETTVVQSPMRIYHLRKKKN